MMAYMENLRAGKVWYSIDMTKEKAEKFKLYLRDHDIQFEPSECYNLIHFECFMTEKELDLANEWLEKN